MADTRHYAVKRTPGSKLTPEQLKRLIVLAKQLDKAEAGYEGAYGLKPRGINEDFFTNKLKRQTAYLASDGKGTVGMALSTPSSANYDNAIDYINMVSVDKKHRGQGIGRRLIRAAIRDSIRKNRTVMLRVNVNNPAGLHLYESMGFKPFSQAMVYQGGKTAGFSSKVASVLWKAAALGAAMAQAPSPTAAPQTQPPITSPSTDYTVARGDTLSAIAKRNGTTWQNLAQLNGIKNPNRISPGQQLKLPSSPTAAPVAPVAAPAGAPVTSTQRLNQVSARLHTKLNNPNLEAAILANFNRETGGKFDYTTKQVGGGGYGLPQYTGPSLTAYKGWLAQNKLQDSANNQIDYFTDKYMPTRAGYKKYMAPGAQFTKEQYADWLHRRVFTPAHTIKGNKAYNTATILRHTRAHNDFMNNRLKAVNGVWTGVGG